MGLRDYAEHTIDGVYTYCNNGILHTHCSTNPYHTLMHEMIGRHLGQDYRQLVQRQDIEIGIIQNGVF